MASRAIFITEGRIIYDGTLRELFKEGEDLEAHFRELCGAGK